MKKILLFGLLSLPPCAGLRAQEPIKTTMRILPDGSSRTTVVNPDAHTSEEIFAESNGKVIRKTTYLMNEQNVATGATHFDGKGAVRYKEVYTLDASGRITESKLYSRDGKPIGRRVFTYDAQNRAQVQDYDATGNPIAARAPASDERRGKIPRVAPPKR